MKNLFFIFLLGILAAGCDPTSALKKEMIDNPTTQPDKDKNAILQYLIDNKITNAQSTDSGIYYIMEKEGDGAGHPNAQSSITAHYHGTLLDGTVFDSSVEKGRPFTFGLNRVVKGWQQAIPLLSKGGKGKFIIPSDLAYGPRGSGGKIGPNSVLIFDIELIDFVQPLSPEEQAAKDQEIIKKYIANKKLDNVKTTDSGIHYIIEKEGDGKGNPNATSKVKVHYHGTLLDGTVFDSSVERGETIEFGLNQVIPGWQQAIPLLSKGGKGKFIIPSGLAYGPRGAGGKIGPNSVLIFDVELFDF